MIEGRLPPELISAILAFLALDLDDLESLQGLCSCSLVSRSFHFETIPHLFSSISIHDKAYASSYPQEQPSRSGAFLGIMQDNPAIGLAVQSITFESRVPFSHDLKTFRLHESPMLLLMVTRLSNITHATIRHTRELIFWNDIAPDVRNIFELLLTMPSIQSLSFESIFRIPLEVVFSPSRGLLRLSLSEARLASPGSHSTTKDPPAPDAQDFAKLRTLHVKIQTITTFFLLYWILKETADTLQSFFLQFSFINPLDCEQTDPEFMA